MLAKQPKRILTGAVLLLAAFVLHGMSSEKTRQGITPPNRGNLPGHEDEFFGEDPREFAARPENQAVLADARRLDGLALATAAAGALVLLSATLIKRRRPLRWVVTPGASRSNVYRCPEPLKQLPGPTIGQPALPS